MKRKPKTVASHNYSAFTRILEQEQPESIAVHPTQSYGWFGAKPLQDGESGFFLYGLEYDVVKGEKSQKFHERTFGAWSSEQPEDIYGSLIEQWNTGLLICNAGRRIDTLQSALLDTQVGLSDGEGGIMSSTEFDELRVAAQGVVDAYNRGHPALRLVVNNA